MTMEATLSHHVVGTRFEDIPPAAIAAAKRSILDTLGVMLAASGLSEEANEFESLSREFGGTEEGTIVGYSKRLPSHMAALVNGALCHPLDFDDTHEDAPCHPTAETLPAALAAAERLGTTSGAELLAAVALATDVVCRIGIAVDTGPTEHGWLPAAVYGYFGAAAAAGRILKLSPEQMQHAFGIVYGQTAGSHEMSRGNGSYRGVRDAFSQHAGLLSALLAQRGITGPTSFLEGVEGLYPLYFKGRYTPSKVLSNLGKLFEGCNVSHKPWPACRLFHPYIDAILQLQREMSIADADVDTVEVQVSGWNMMLSEPREDRLAPKSAMDAKYSLLFTLGIALAHGEVKIEHYLPAALTDAHTISAAKKVCCVLDPSLPNSGITRGALAVNLKSGHRLVKAVEHAYGSRQHPMSDAAIEEKFRDCARYARGQLGADAIEAIIQGVWHLEHVNDIRSLTAMLSASRDGESGRV